MKETFDQINNTVFTKNNIPLPVEDDEDIVYYNPFTKLIFIIGNGIPAITRKFLSYKGSLFLTNYRLIYRPDIPTEYFDSFSVPIAKIQLQDNDTTIATVVDNKYLANIFISFEDSDSSIFYKCLREMYDNAAYKQTYTEEEADTKEEPPYYADICN